MEIIRNKRKGKCYRCRGLITSKYKVKEYEDYYSHLRCYYKHLIRSIKDFKELKKQFSKKKYRRIMILEALER